MNWSVPTFRSLVALAGIVSAMSAVEGGASGYLPEHTLAAKAVAHVMGADFIEQDVVLTRDDHPIVLHDVHVDTVTDVATKYPGRARDDGRFYAIDFTLAEIRTLRVSERIDIETKKAVYPQRFPVGESAFRVPSFRMPAPSSSV